MKSIFTIIAISLIGFSAQAKTITAEQDPALFATYKKAVNEAIYRSQIFYCESSTRWTTSDYLDKSDTLTISETGQPILSFERYEGSWKTYLRITSDATYKNITSISYSTYEKVSVNKGDLLNPNYVDEWKGTYYKCDKSTNR